LPRDLLGFTVNLLTVAEEDQIKCRTEKHWSEPKKAREKVSRLQLKLGNLFGKKSITPIMTGLVRLKTKFDLPPGESDFAKRLRLAGNFQVSGAHFTNEKIQGKIDALSMRSQGKPKLAQDNIPDNVQSDLKGTFGLDNGLISFSQLEFRVPGTQVNLTGTYSLDGNQIDFHGKARLDAKLSHTVTGWKSILLKPADPFFSKNGAGTELPVKVTGIKSEPHFGSDFGHKDESKNSKGGPRN
jgi:hypothetical protein